VLLFLASQSRYRLSRQARLHLAVPSFSTSSGFVYSRPKGLISQRRLARAKAKSQARLIASTHA
jgi:hypothetical protein